MKNCARKVVILYVESMRRLKKKIFLGIFGGTVALLGAARLVYPEMARPEGEAETRHALMPNEARSYAQQGTPLCPTRHASFGEEVKDVGIQTLAKDSAGCVKWHPVRSVPSYAACFPDVQEVQIVSARRWGVRPVRDRVEAEHRRKELVYVGANPLYSIDKGMTHSIPYLVPRAAHLLSTIGRNYLDSLYVKGIPLHKIIVSSVLRTQDDVSRLQQRNGNAYDQSCHLFGTTFDICYNRYTTVSPPGGPERRTVQSDTLKWVLSEVLRDVREQGRCYIKYEVKQGCFHITVR